MVEFNGQPVKVDTAHFGLTAIKLDRLKDVPKPWCWSTPTEDGLWEDGQKTDEDIYFWRQWQKHGRTIYVDGSVNIGHMEEMVSGFDETGKHMYCYPNEWYEVSLATDKTDESDNAADQPE
jgi:hypothetical protein